MQDTMKTMTQICWFIMSYGMLHILEWTFTGLSCHMGYFIYGRFLTPFLEFMIVSTKYIYITPFLEFMIVSTKYIYITTMFTD